MRDQWLTERLLARSPGPADQDGYRELFLDPAVGEWLRPAPMEPFSDAEISDMLSEDELHWAEHGFGPWVLVEREGGSTVGRGGLRWTEVDGTEGGGASLGHRLRALEPRPGRRGGVGRDRVGRVAWAARGRRADHGRQQPLTESGREGWAEARGGDPARWPSPSDVPALARRPGRSGPRGVTVMEQEGVAVRVAEEGHVADAAVDRLAVELDALRLELGPCRFDVADVEADRMAAGLELAADRGGVHHLQGEAAGLELAARDFPVVDGVLQAQHRAVELDGGGVVLDEDGDEVDAGDSRGRGHPVANLLRLPRIRERRYGAARAM